MRPGRFHPGNGTDRVQSFREALVASMRPGRFHPGNKAGVPVQEAKGKELQ